MTCTEQASGMWHYFRDHVVLHRDYTNQFRVSGLQISHWDIILLPVYTWISIEYFLQQVGLECNISVGVQEIINIFKHNREECGINKKRYIGVPPYSTSKFLLPHSPIYIYHLNTLQINRDNVKLIWLRTRIWVS